MATDSRVPKPSKWFSNKSLRISLHRNKSNSGATLSPPRSPMSPRTPKFSSREDELREVFRRFDGDGDGKISALELREYFGSIGEYMSHEEAQGVIDDLDSDSDNLLDFQDFLRLMKKEGGGGGSGGGEGGGDEDLKKAFEMFELEKGSGRITPRGLQRMLQRLGDTKSFEECEAMIQVYDTDGNGVLDFNEFHQMMA